MQEELHFGQRCFAQILQTSDGADTNLKEFNSATKANFGIFNSCADYFQKDLGEKTHLRKDLAGSSP